MTSKQKGSERQQLVKNVAFCSSYTVPKTCFDSWSLHTPEAANILVILACRYSPNQAVIQTLIVWLTNHENLPLSRL